jgi:hypothetical protein
LNPGRGESNKSNKSSTCFRILTSQSIAISYRPKTDEKLPRAYFLYEKKKPIKNGVEIQDRGATNQHSAKLLEILGEAALPSAEKFPVLLNFH